MTERKEASTYPDPFFLRHNVSHLGHLAVVGNATSWIPLVYDAGELGRSWKGTFIFARLRIGVSM